MACSASCQCSGARGQKSILYSILRENDQPTQRSLRRQRFDVPQERACSCGFNKTAVLRAPLVTSKATSAVLLKTLRFVKNVPCFRELPAKDQLQLVRNSWAPLLVLGMAQDAVDFETVETSEPSMLQKILTNCQNKQETSNGHNGQGVSLVDVQGIQMFLSKCWGLNISTKEYAYLKGVILFNPEIAELQSQRYILSLQREAYKALHEYVKMIYQGDYVRFAKLYIAISMLQSINAQIVASLFFGSVIGNASIDDLLLEMFYQK
ncbi:nuclear receptor subfamily 0 group B member 1 [Osmerus mordax]|uniref:nuclear receptor subfamily 0 group B member 1 n=1 Tax=Osmerus mordax TaxID=8014 RepID=UPI00350EFA7B